MQCDVSYAILILIFLVSPPCFCQFDNPLMHFRALEANVANSSGQDEKNKQASYRTEFGLDEMHCVLLCEHDSRCTAVRVQFIAAWEVKCHFFDSDMKENDSRQFDIWVKVSSVHCCLTSPTSRNFRKMSVISR